MKPYTSGAVRAEFEITMNEFANFRKVSMTSSPFSKITAKVFSPLSLMSFDFMQRARFGIQHCIFFNCLMNGSNHLDESDRRPLHVSSRSSKAPLQHRI